MTDEELDALVSNLKTCSEYLHLPPSVQSIKNIRCMEAMDKAADAITALRQQLAELQAELSRRVDMHECAMAERDDATLYGVEQKARADSAEAERAAQIEADAVICDKHSYSNNQYVSMRMIDAAREIRAQPHDRTALDRMLRAEREKALRDAADRVKALAPESRTPQGDYDHGWNRCAAVSQDAILAMIPSADRAKGASDAP